MNVRLEVLAQLITIYLVISSVCLFFGMISTKTDCHTPTTRIGYIFPAYKLGCWLTEAP